MRASLVQKMVLPSIEVSVHAQKTSGCTSTPENTVLFKTEVTVPVDKDV